MNLLARFVCWLIVLTYGAFVLASAVRLFETSKLVEWRPSDRCVAELSILGDTSVLPSARACGARATESSIVSARAGVVAASPVVRLTDGFIARWSSSRVAELPASNPREAMADDEDLEPWNWRVWLIEQPRRRAVKVARTRLAALLQASKQLGVDVDRLDAEVVRT